METPYLYQKTAKGVSKKPKEPTVKLTVLNTPDKIAHLEPEVLREIGEELRLAYMDGKRGVWICNKK